MAEDRTAARLYLLMTALSSASTPEAVAGAVLTEGVAALGASGGGVLLAANGERIVVPGSVGYEQVLLERLRSESRDAELPAAVSLRTGDSVWVESRADRDDRFPELVEFEAGTASICAVPLAAHGRRIGALRFSFSEPRRFDDDERRFVLTLAGQCAQALDRAQQYEARLDASTRLQRSLLPPELPTIPGVEVAAGYSPLGSGVEIGGDFYDVWPVGDRWAFAIGDVCGSGTDRAALTAQVRFTLRALTMRSESPTEILRLLDANLSASAQSWNDVERFCTVVFGFVWVGNGMVDVDMAGGGHPPPMIRREGGSVEELRPFGSLLGVLEEASVSGHRVRLQPGDCVLLYTDGLSEARKGRDQFGTERIARTFAEAPDDAKGIIGSVQHAVLSFAEGSLGDDLALLVLRAQS